MTRFKEAEHERAKLLAKELEDQGYSVILEPDPSQIPFNIMNYRPDLIAMDAAGNLIVEVRTRSDSRSQLSATSRLPRRCQSITAGDSCFQRLTSLIRMRIQKSNRSCRMKPSFGH